MAELQTQYETEQKERQIIQLQNETLTKDLELQRTRTFIWWIIAGVVFVGIVVFGLLKRNQFKLRLARIKEHEELQRQRFSAVITDQKSGGNLAYDYGHHLQTGKDYFIFIII